MTDVIYTRAGKEMMRNINLALKHSRQIDRIMLSGSTPEHIASIPEPDFRAAAMLVQGLLRAFLRDGGAI